MSPEFLIHSMSYLAVFITKILQIHNRDVMFKMMKIFSSPQ